MEFSDADAAASAVRNLDKYPIGGRELRVDYSHVGAKEDAATNAPIAIQTTAAINNPPNPILGPLPMGAELPAGLTCPDAISKTLSTLPPAQLLDILSQMKALVMSDPIRASELLKQAPQLSYAIFQALLLMGLVDANLIATVLEQSVQASPAVAAPIPTPIPARPYIQQQQQPTHYHTPPIAPPYQPPPQPQQQQPAFPPGQEQLIRQLLAMPQSDIDRLGPTERNQVMLLRQQFSGMV